MALKRIAPEYARRLGAWDAENASSKWRKESKRLRNGLCKLPSVSSTRTRSDAHDRCQCTGRRQTQSYRRRGMHINSRWAHSGAVLSGALALALLLHVAGIPAALMLG